MPQKKGGGLFAKIVGVVYSRFGAAGLLGIPFGSLTMEKSLYDTYCAYHGHSIYEAADASKPKHGGFPSGGSALPSFSLLKTRNVAADERATFRMPMLDSAWCAVCGTSESAEWGPQSAHRTPSAYGCLCRAHALLGTRMCVHALSVLGLPCGCP